MNACYVMTHRQNLPSFARTWAAAESTTSSENIVTQSFKKKKPPKYLIRLGKGHSKDSFQDLLRTVRNKPHSAPTNQMSGTKEHRMSPAGALTAAKPRILDLIQGAATAGLLPPPSSTPLTTLRDQQLKCTCKKQPKQQTTHGSKQYRDTTAQQSQNPEVPEVEQSCLASQHDDDDSEHVPHPKKAVSANRSSPCCLTEPGCDD